MTTKVAEDDRIPYDPDKFVSDAPEDRQDLQKKLVKKVKKRFEEYGGAINSSIDDIAALNVYSHEQNKDQYLDYGGVNQVAVADVKDAVDKKHTRLHSINGASDHNSPGGTEDNIVLFDASGYPVKDSGKKISDIDIDIGEGHIPIFPWAYVSIGQGTWAFQHNASMAYQSQWFNTSNADGDNISYAVSLAKGTYTLKILGYRATNRGICDVDIDEDEVAEIDTYGAADENHIWSQTGITISSSGLKTLKLRIDGKNASSTDYYISISMMVLYRTA
jgi:hypothetical protein